MFIIAIGSLKIFFECIIFLSVLFPLFYNPMSSNVLIQFIDDPSSNPIQVPSTITLTNLHNLLGNAPSLFVHGQPILTSLDATLSLLSISHEEVVPITSVYSSSRPATFCSSSFSGHNAAVLAVKLHGNKLVSVGGDSTVRFWDTITKTQYKVQNVNKHWVLGIDCTDEYVGCCSMDGNVSIYNWQGEFIKHVGMHKKGATHICMNGDKVISGGRDGVVAVWQHNGECSFSYRHEGPVDDLLVVRDFIISCGRDIKIKIYKNMKYIKDLKNHTKRINSIKLSGSIMASGGDDCRVFLYNVEKDFAVTKELHHKHVVCGVAISGNNLYVASCSFDMTVRLWDIKTGKLLGSYFHVSAVYRVRFRDNLLISWGKDKLVKTFCTNKREVVSELLCGDEVFDVDANDHLMVAACRDRKVYFFG